MEDMKFEDTSQKDAGRETMDPTQVTAADTDTAGKTAEDAVADAAADVFDLDLSPLDPPADDQGADGDTTPDGDGKKPPAWVRPLAIAIGVILVLAAAAGGYAYAAWNVGKGVDSAASWADGEDTTLGTAVKDAKKVLESTDESQVADPATLDALSKAVETAEDERGVDVTAPNRLLVWRLLEAQDAYDTDARDAAAARKALGQAVKTVRASIAEQAKATLQGKVDAAGKLMTDSDGKVQDNATRDTLRQAIDQANTLLGDDSASVDDLNAAGQVIDQATTGVNDSVKAKQDADAQAAAEAAAAAAAAQATQQAQQSYTPSYSGGYSNSSGGYTGGGYAPSYSGGGSSSPSGGSSTSGGSSSGGSGYDFGQIDNTYACQPGEYCPIG